MTREAKCGEGVGERGKEKVEGGDGGEKKRAGRNGEKEEVELEAAGPH